MGATIKSDRIDVVFPISEMLDRPFYFPNKDGDTRVDYTIRDALRVVAWRLLWLHAKGNMEKFVKDNEGKFVSGDVLVDGVDIKVTFHVDMKVPYPPEVKDGS